ncbi:MAG: DNA repair protein RecN [Ruminococcaceae bacterium]|nr:DNA repair protein RecN [Oscillospiraceae bacterium]
MLKELHIKNVAVIDEVHIEFAEGFNALTGETGAGKSILIDSINMALGNRTSRDIIRHGCDFASVDMCFEIENPAVFTALSGLGIDAEDGIVTVSRKLTADGKSTCRINGMLSPANMVREAASLLIDIHGQNDNQSLLNAKNHLALLDEYANLSCDLNEYRTVYHEYRSIEKEIEALSADEDERVRRLELLRFQADEITAAALKIGEDDELEQSRNRLYNMESIISGAGSAYAVLYGGDEGTACDLLRQAVRAISSVAQFDPTLSESLDRLSGVVAETEDIASDIGDLLSKSDFSVAELDRIEERLDLISSLKRKYGNTIEEINTFAANAAEQADKIEKSDERLEELEDLKNTVLSKVKDLAARLSEKRHTAAKVLETKIAEELSALDMPKVKFSINLTGLADEHFTDTGADSAEFLISTNPGEDLKPMVKIASGGELSRIMLAIKSVLSVSDMVDSMIFDEIDTGVSGRAAQKIAEKICALSRGKQVFAITHLAQIASMADNHFLIEKDQSGDKASTSVRLLDEAARIHELARIIGGVTVTDLTLENAREMLRMADEKKRS